MKNTENIVGLIIVDDYSNEFVISNQTNLNEIGKFGGAIISHSDLETAKKLFIDGMNLAYAVRNLLNFEKHYTNLEQLDWIKIPSITFKHLN